MHMVVCLPLPHASIWLHQFLKAMRDKQGRLLHGAHMIGFFRRICKLLYYGILPVFVYDGVAPALKRLTMASRRHRRVTMEQSLRKTAERILSLQLKKHAIEATLAPSSIDCSLDVAVDTGADTSFPEGTTSANGEDHHTREATRVPKRHLDEYELPRSDMSRFSTLGQYDERLATEEELRSFISTHRDSIDLSRINIDSNEFKNLPIEIQHEVIIELKNQARAPDDARVQSMIKSSATVLEFSKLQIRNLVHRNALTQRTTLFAQNAGVVKSHASLAKEGASNGWKRKHEYKGRRVAGVRNRDFMLIKNEEIGMDTQERGVMSATGVDAAARHIGGWTMAARDADKRVVDGTTGMQGFAVMHSISRSLSPTPDISTQPATNNHVDKADGCLEDVVDITPLWQASQRQPIPHRDRDTSQDQPLIDNIAAYVSDDQTIEQVLAQFNAFEKQAIYARDTDRAEHDLDSYPYEPSDGWQLGINVGITEHNNDGHHEMRTKSSEASPTFESGWNDVGYNGDTNNGILRTEAADSKPHFQTNSAILETPCIPAYNGSIITIPDDACQDSDLCDRVPDSETVQDIMDRFLSLDSIHSDHCTALAASPIPLISSPVHTPMATTNDAQKLISSPHFSNEASDTSLQASKTQHISNAIYEVQSLSPSQLLVDVGSDKEYSHRLNCPVDPDHVDVKIPSDLLELEKTYIEEDDEFITCWRSIAPETLDCCDLAAPGNNWFSMDILDVDLSHLTNLIHIIIKRRGKSALGSERDHSCRFLERYLTQVRERRTKRRSKTIHTGSDHSVMGYGGMSKSEAASLGNSSVDLSAVAMDSSNSGHVGIRLAISPISENVAQRNHESNITISAVDGSRGDILLSTHGMMPLGERAERPKSISAYLSFDEESGDDMDDGSAIGNNVTNGTALSPHLILANDEEVAVSFLNPVDSCCRGEGPPQSQDDSIIEQSALSPGKLASLAILISDDNDTDDDTQWHAVPVSVEPTFDSVGSVNTAPNDLLGTDAPTVPAKHEASQVNVDSTLHYELDDDDNDNEDPDTQLSLVETRLEELEREGQSGDSAIDVPMHLDEELQDYAAYFTMSDNNERMAPNVDELDRELTELEKQQRREIRDASDITASMIAETQELLKQFGIPYIVAPTEAESQCAFLFNQGLVEGIVTDDSDAFVFGGGVVFKNMFTQNRSVEMYKLDDLQASMGLTQQRLIFLAYLLGSDYTPGLTGVGPVTSVEILKEWCSGSNAASDSESSLRAVESLSGLTEFRKWVNAVSSGIVDPNDSQVRKKLRNLAKKLDIPESFPDPRVLDAYIHPEVDGDPTDFTWAEPDLDGIRRLLEHKLEWTHDTVDLVLIPVIKKMHESKSALQQYRSGNELEQTNMTRFFPVMNGPEGAKRQVHKSLRVRNVLEGWSSKDPCATVTATQSQPHATPSRSGSKIRGRGRNRASQKEGQGSSKRVKLTSKGPVDKVDSR
ncbi:hypothetical protein BASA50_002101 [Batrachochytrium salamandrivorans]|uniref:XPG-I domain-containing protein n=1 Tax=Batrachochytrium salamandrivorans TaxID=1357716 RepID=A0ABQ8FMD6_9FUNG|nr:hypothetical protein BASA50_002101 [Batrachochytrium salamandrivorans]